MGTDLYNRSTFEYNYRTAPQKHYDGRQVYNAGGKQLSGSSSVNYAMWTRGGADDYNLWASIVGDKRWSYNGLLPYFRKTETHHDPQGVDPQQHGFEGPIHTTASAGNYPLKSSFHQAYRNVGLKETKDANDGNPIGIAPYTENWRDGKRQPAGKAYGLKGVDVVTNSMVRKIILDGTKAVGVELASGHIVMAKKEVILSCGSIRTPQVLMLSGIGPKHELEKHGIEQLIDSPEVGQNFHDHCCLAQFYKIKNPEKGLAAGSPLFNDPSYLLGVPADMVVTFAAPRDALKAAMQKDSMHVPDSHPHLAATRGHCEILPIYAPTEAPLTDLNIPFDGTCITAGILNLLPTSRGQVTLASADPSADPISDPNYFATEADRVIMRHGMRVSMRALESPEGREVIDHEVTPAGYPALTSKSSDAELDARVKRAAATWFHFAGSASMGTVVDTDLRVNGVDALRVVDASVITTPIGAHLQVATYAIAEQAAEIIAKDHGSAHPISNADRIV